MHVSHTKKTVKMIEYIISFQLYKTICQLQQSIITTHDPHNHFYYIELSHAEKVLPLLTVNSIVKIHDTIMHSDLL